MSTNDCFSTLGIPFGSNTEKIKQAYRELAKKHHPDLGGSAERFVRIQKAYENLMDTSKTRTSGSSQSSTSSSSSGSSYWRSWETGGSWWNTSNAHRYSTEEDFDAEFEAQWRKFNSQRRSEKSSRRKFRSRADFRSNDDNDTNNEGMDQDEAYAREKSENERYSRGRGRERVRHNRAKDQAPPSKVSVSHEDGKKSALVEPLSGDYDQVSKFNGRVCYMNRVKNLFLFWSNKNRDWKISNKLKDDGNCIAFNDKDSTNPWTLQNKWMVWSDRSRRYVQTSISHKASVIDYSTWSVSRLRSALEKMGLGVQIEAVFEKSQLVEMMEMWSKIDSKKKRSDENPRDTTNKNTPDHVPEGHFQVCSRQRHDGVVQAPPVLSEKCTVAKNRIEKFVGPIDELDEWVYLHGDRRRFYGVYDHENNYCFGLIWKDNKHWGRAGKHDY